MPHATPVLCVDVGNTFTKFSMAGWRTCVPLGHRRTRDIVTGRVGLPRAVLDTRAQPSTVEAVWVSSVVPAANGPLRRLLARTKTASPVFVDASVRLPFRLGIRDPQRLGADRICAAAGAVRHRRRSVVVVDIGSAATVDLVSEGRYRGGLILPGPGLHLAALGGYAEKLPAIPPSRLRAPLPAGFTETRDAMVLGAVHGAAGAVIAAAARVAATAPTRPTVVVGGGGASVLDRFLPRGWTRSPHLVPFGLYALYRLSRK